MDIDLVFGMSTLTFSAEEGRRRLVWPLCTCLALAPKPKHCSDSVMYRWAGATHSKINSLASPPVKKNECFRFNYVHNIYIVYIQCVSSRQNRNNGKQNAFIFTEMNDLSDCFFSQLYHGENKLIFNDDNEVCFVLDEHA
jgi:hypothetical protein